MITSIKHKGLQTLFDSGKSAKVQKHFHARILRQLSALDAASKPGDMNIPGWDYHSLEGYNPTRYAVSVNGPWRITFEFDGANACQIDFEQYH